MQNDLSYSAVVAEHFRQPRNIGRFAAGADIVESSVGSLEQGVSFHLSAQVAGDRLKAVRFESYGCPHCIAAASWLSERLVGCTREDLERWNWREAADTVELPAEKRGRLLILEDAVRALAHAWRQRS
jgi:nitrogen fixation protein NifU and related proteins